MRTQLGVVVMLAACRVDFDPVGGGALAHDEDADGVIDSVDDCPFIADPAQVDTDGDGVGDACDPEPAIPRQSLALFAPMTEPASDTLFWSASTGTMTELGDAWHYDGTDGAAVVAKVALADSDIWLGIDIDQVLGFPRQAAIDIEEAVFTPYYYADCYDAGGNPDVGIEYADGTGYQALQSKSLPNGIATGALVYHVAVRTAASGTAAFTSTLAWPPESYTTTAPTPGYTGHTQFVLVTSQLAFDLRWLAVVTTHP
jgi:hypothetical protein